MIGSTLDQWLVEDREFPEAAKTGFVNGLFAGGKDYMLSLFGKGGAGKEAGKLLVGTGMDTAKGVYQETDKYNKDYDEFMSGAHKGKSGEVPDVLKNPKSMTNIVASQGGKAVLSNAAGAVTGKAGEESAAGGVVTAITANAASDVGGKAIDALSKQGSEDEDLDLQRALEGAASKKTKDLSSTSGLLENFLSPAVSQSMEQTKPAFVSAVDKG